MNKKCAFYEQISAIAVANPDAIALENSQGLKISYQELENRTNFLADKLGKQNGNIIGIYGFSDSEYVIGLLGIAKAGAAFLPLDVHLPMSRIQEYLKITNCKKVLFTANISEKVRNSLIKNLAEKSIECELIEQKESINNQSQSISPNDPAYVMFTSGSSGTPKAVLGNHKGLAHFLRWEIEEFQLDQKIKSSWLAPITFDVSLRDILIPLLVGGTLCIPTEEERTIPHLLAQWLVEMKVNLMHTIPTVLRLLTKALGENEIKLPELSYVLIAGEPLYSRDVISFKENAMIENQELECVNVYGPTETTLAKAFYKVPKFYQDEENTLLPIGKAISNTSLLILEEGRLCDILEIGEIFIRTPYRTLGYVANDAENAKAFIKNPLTTEENDIIYKTGDMGRYLDDGNVECLGRRDNQVKINGVRIEFGEIEFALRDIADVQDATVTAIESGVDTFDKQKILIAYLVLAENSTITSKTANEKVRSILSQKLPLAYIPSMIFTLEKIPYTTSGKVNRRLLPKPDEMFYANIEYIAPTNETEEKLCVIWREIFGREKIGIDLTFASFGGDSLRSIKAISMIYSTFGINIPVQYFFEHNTIQEIANYLLQSE